MGKLELRVNVHFPEMRLRLHQAVDALCDEDFQDRLWLQGRRTDSFELGFEDTMLFLIDEMEMFSTTELVGDVLINGSELAAFTGLADAVEKLMAIIGDRGTFKDARASGPPWQSCVVQAREMRQLLDAAG